MNKEQLEQLAKELGHDDLEGMVRYYLNRTWRSDGLSIEDLGNDLARIISKLSLAAVKNDH